MSDALDDWVMRHVDQGSDLDGAYGAQCWDLFAAYCVELLGAPGAWACSTAQSGPNAGYAGSLWEQFPTSGWMGATFDRLGADADPRRGDVAVWGNDPTHPTTHVAIVIEDGVHDGRIHVLAQNVDASMVARDMWDIAATDGYLRPKNGIDDMPSAQEIAEAVWNFDQNGVKTRDRLQGIDGAANAAAQSAARIETTANRNDGRLYRILQSLKDFAGVPKDDTQTVPDLWKNERLSLIDGRVYRLALTIKRFFGIADEDMDVPGTVASPQIAAAQEEDRNATQALLHQLTELSAQVGQLQAAVDRLANTTDAKETTNE